MHRFWAGRLFAAIALVAVLGICTPGFADQYAPVSVAINNAGFESQNLSSTIWSIGTPGWNLVAGTAGALGGGLYGTGAWSPNGAPEGLNVAWLGQYSTLSQTLTDPYGTVNPYYNYTLSFAVGQRYDQGAINYSVQFWAGGQLLAQNTNDVHPGAGQFIYSSLYYSTFVGNPPYGSPLEIRLVNLGTQQILFDDFKLTAVDPEAPALSALSPSIETPEPASLMLLGTGALALLGMRRRKR